MKTFTSQFFINKNDLSTRGTNPYFILQPGYRLVLKGQEAGKKLKLIITVLNKTKTVNGVKTRIVEEIDFENGKIVEISRNFFAISKKTNSVFYFGEEVDIFDQRGRIVSHEGAWRSGRNGARAGLIMSGTPLNGARYFQEMAPRVALDRSEILTNTDAIRVPAGKFKNVLKIKETTPLEPGIIDFKFYARGIGLIKETGVSLVKHGFIKCPRSEVKR